MKRKIIVITLTVLMLFIFIALDFYASIFYYSGKSDVYAQFFYPVSQYEICHKKEYGEWTEKLSKDNKCGKHIKDMITPGKYDIEIKDNVIVFKIYVNSYIFKANNEGWNIKKGLIINGEEKYYENKYKYLFDYTFILKTKNCN